MDRGVPDQPRTYTAAGTSFIYKRPYNSEKGESIVADGPTNEDIEIWVRKIPRFESSISLQTLVTSNILLYTLSDPPVKYYLYNHFDTVH